MKWLEPPQDEAERVLREALDQAALRTGDEITHRRLWTRIAEAAEQPQPRRVGRFVFASAAVGVLAVAGVLLVARPWQAPLVSERPAESSEPSSVVTPPPLIEPEREPGQVVATRAGEHARVALGSGAEAELAESSSITWDDQNRPSIRQGAAKLSVPRQPPGWRFSVTAGPYVVTVVGTKFEVRVDRRTVGVEVTEGVVEVWHGTHSTRLAAGDSWHGPLEPEPEAAAPTVRPRTRGQFALRHPIRVTTTMSGRALRDVQAALRAGDTNKAIEMLGRIAAGSGPAAENASYELGRVARDRLNRPRQAVAVWERYRTRFPNGLLRTEADLSILDTLSSLGDLHAALVEAEAFLARHPGSERRGEVQRLADRLRAAESAAGAR